MYYLTANTSLKKLDATVLTARTSTVYPTMARVLSPTCRWLNGTDGGKNLNAKKYYTRNALPAAHASFLKNDQNEIVNSTTLAMNQQTDVIHLEIHVLECTRVPSRPITRCTSTVTAPVIGQ